MRAITTVLPDEEATRALGRLLGDSLRPGDVLALVGPLGAGKTTLVQGIAEALDLPPGVPVQSPTFTVCNEYPTRVPILHVDLYRLGDISEAEDIGLVDRLTDGDGIGVVEWAARLPDLIPETALWIRLEHDSGSRRVTVAEGDGGDVQWLMDQPIQGGAPPWTPRETPLPWEVSSSA